jgi:serine/threonine protein kinase KIN1/2
LLTLADCKSIIARMLVVDPKERATLQEIMNHPWMTKGYNSPPESYLPAREPLQLPLDSQVIEKMTGFDFGSAAYITEQLTRIVDSEDYKSAVRKYTREDGGLSSVGEKKRGVFDFYKRRNSVSREGLSAASAEAIRGIDPTNAYSPLISIYYLAREKRDRERNEANPGGLAMPISPGEKPLAMPDLPPPEAAHTNQHAYEMPGEKATGGRSRPRARTHGDDEVVQGMEKLDVAGKRGPSTPSRATPPSEPTVKKEGTAMGLLRRFSTRRNKDKTSDRPAAPAVNIQPPIELAPPPRKSFSVRRSRWREPSPTTMHAGGSQPQQEGLLSASDANAGSSRSSRFLGRSTSVNSAEYRPNRYKSRGVSEAMDSPRLAPEPPNTSGSDRSSISGQKNAKGNLTETIAADATTLTAPRTPSSRPRSLGHARRESIQARRQRREEAKDKEGNLPEETDAEMREEAGPPPDTPGADVPSKVYLKGLFSVSTTSNKPLPFIRQDIIRVLKQLGVEFTEVKGGFSCRHAPSINLEKVRDPGSPLEEEKSGRVTSGHQRRISFSGFRRDRDEAREDKVPRQSSRRGPPDRSFITNSEGSDEYVRPVRDNNTDGVRDMGATTTRVQSDTGENLVLRFDVFIVKVPLFNLHGIQFKKVQGGMNQYKHMATRILASLRL